MNKKALAVLLSLTALPVGRLSRWWATTPAGAIMEQPPLLDTTETDLLRSASGMSQPGRSDQWSRWLLDRRGDREFAEEYIKVLHQVRDVVLDNAKLTEGVVVLDVGAGDGLIAFGVLERIGATGRAIFANISPPLLDHSRALALQRGVSDRCTFIRASAEDLRPVPDESVDVVTTRSVLIFVADKAGAFREFRRVLKPAGRISLFEPINRYTGLTEPPTRVCGTDVPDIADLARRLWAFYRSLQPLETYPMMNFDERDLVALCEGAGFVDIHVTLHILVRLRAQTTVPPFPPACRASAASGHQGADELGAPRPSAAGHCHEATSPIP